jgi:hypothetical protein
VAVEGLPTPDKDLSWPRGGDKSGGVRLAAKIVLLSSLGLLAILLAVVLIHQAQGGRTDITEFTTQLVELREPWAEKLAGNVDSYRGWFERHGTSMELSIFDDISGLLLSSIIAFKGSPDESLLDSLYVSVHEGLIRLMFMVLASLRAWIAIAGFSFYFGFIALKPYKGDDILGQTGNGRLYYSGARGGLEKLSDTGAPDVLVRGLACPAEATPQEVTASPLWKLLGEFKAQNDTNKSLVAIILKHGDTAPFVARLEDEPLLQKTYSGEPLKEYLHALLNGALSLHASYVSGEGIQAAPQVKGAPPTLPYSPESYVQALKVSLHRVLLPELRELLGSLETSEIATFILALESGKVLAHSFEGGKWIRKSNFPQLSARAVLHSVLAYPKEYDFHARHRIRHGLVYASRSSSFAAVRMPQGMLDSSWALRQWAEVLLSSPFELDDVVDEVELVGLTRAMRNRWEGEVLARAAAIAPDLPSTCYTTMSNLFFVPIPTIVALLRRTIEPGQLGRLTELSGLVSATQRRKYEKANQGNDDGLPARTFDRVFAPLNNEELSTLASLHGVGEEELREWSAMRNILASHGWLARRVGDYTVPESSVIFSVFKAPAGYPGANTLGLFGKSGLVPLRGGKFAEVWGYGWDSRFQSFQKATMSENREHFEKVLKGIKDETPEEEQGIVAPPTQA